MQTLSPPSGLESRLRKSVFSGSRRVSSNWLALGLVATSGIAAAFFAVQLASRTHVPDPQIVRQETNQRETVADSAYLGGPDPMGGGVSVVAVGYAGGH